MGISTSAPSTFMLVAMPIGTLSVAITFSIRWSARCGSRLPMSARWRVVASSRSANCATRAKRVAMSSLWKPGMREFLAGEFTVVSSRQREGKSIGHEPGQPGDQAREGRADQQRHYLQQHEGGDAAVHGAHAQLR